MTTTDPAIPRKKSGTTTLATIRMMESISLIVFPNVLYAIN